MQADWFSSGTFSTKNESRLYIGLQAREGGRDRKEEFDTWGIKKVFETCI